MNDISRLFAQLTGELEDLHGLAVEGQAADQLPQVLHALTDGVATGLHHIARTLRDIRLSLPDV